jgi:hypothetical protein
MRKLKTSEVIIIFMVCVSVTSLCIINKPSKVCIINKPSKVRATWIWNSEVITKDTQHVFNFAEKNRINLIFLQINQKQDVSEYRSFIDKASSLGIAIHALDGDPSWAKEENKHKTEDLVHWVESYNNEASSLQKIRGIHLDVEPYNQPAWETHQRQSIIDGWLAAMIYFTNVTKGLKDVEIGADLPFWLDQIPVTTSKDAVVMSRWMLQKLDYVTIMAYRDQALSHGGIVDVVKNDIETANQLNKKVIVGIETNSTGESNTTFITKGISYLIEQLQLVDNSLSMYSSYGGVAVHDYEGWTKMEQRSPNAEPFPAP